MGSAKAAVLPVPVCAVPIKSFPARIIGNARSWIGVGSANPIARVPPTTSGESPKLLNDTMEKLGGFQSPTTERADHSRHEITGNGVSRVLNFSRSFLRSAKFWLQNSEILRNAARIRND